MGVINNNGGGYDGSLRMFTDPVREPDMGRLRFLRWLAERRRLEHGTAGAPSGEFASSRVIGGGSDGDNEATAPKGEFMTRRIEGLGKARERGI